MNEQWLEHLPLKDIKEISPVSGGDVNEKKHIESKQIRIHFSYLSNVDVKNHFMLQKLQV